jgi:alpha-ketoglutarate-dependent sulfate ester dioxygenase
MSQGVSLEGSLSEGADSLDCRPLSPNIGAEVVGVDLSSSLDEATVSAIRHALLQWRVLFFRDQKMDRKQQIDFGQRFGGLSQGHPFEVSDPAYPEIFTIDRRKSESRYGRFSADEESFHTDVTAAVNPPASCIMRAETVPACGGDTVWTNLIRAYEALPTELQELADKLRAVHRYPTDATNPHRYSIDVSGEHPSVVTEKQLASEHPVVSIHPGTRERALFVNPVFTSHIVGFGSRESRKILDLFFSQIATAEFTVRFRWEPGSVAFWDNRATAHFGCIGLNLVDTNRTMHRVCVLGDIPIGPDGMRSESLKGPMLAAPST